MFDGNISKNRIEKEITKPRPVVLNERLERDENERNVFLFLPFLNVTNANEHRIRREESFDQIDGPSSKFDCVY